MYTETFSAKIVSASTLCATRSQAPQTEKEGHNRREGLRSALQSDVKELHVRDPILQSKPVVICQVSQVLT